MPATDFFRAIQRDKHPGSLVTVCGETSGLATPLSRNNRDTKLLMVIRVRYFEDMLGVGEEDS